MRKFVLFVMVMSVCALYTQHTMAQTPSISNLDLNADPSGNSTNDDLETSYSVNGSVVETAVAWIMNGSPIMTAYLPFEAGPTNALLDFSGSDNHASTTGNPSSTPVWADTAGYNRSGGFHFDGNDYLMLGNALPLSSSYSKTAWVYDTGSGYRNIISSELQIHRNHFLNVFPDGSLNAGHSFGNAIVTDPDPLDQERWYFVGVTFDYETGEMVLYKDAQIVDRKIVHDTLRNIVDPGVLIGAKNFLYGWKGSIDEARIYNRVLSQDQMRELYNGGIDDLQFAETRAGEDWYVQVTPFSISELGTTVTSNTISLEALTLSTPTLEASSPDNLSVDDLTVSYTTNASVVETATAWYRDGVPDALLYFPFDGGPANGLLDFSGNDNHLTRPLEALRSPRWEVGDGINGSGAFYFNGNDYLEVENVFPLNSSYTKSAWVYCSDYDYTNIMSSRLHAANNHFFKVDPDGTLNAGHSLGNDIVSDPAPLALSTWYFVAVTFDFATGEMTLYKNGVEVDQAVVPADLLSVVDATVQIGSMQTVYGWRGYLDDARLHNRVLSAEQLMSIYSMGKDIIVAEETSGGEEWSARVTPFSDSEYGAQEVSNALTIQSILVSGIPGESISEGSSFSTFDLDDYVTSYDFPEGDLVWTASGNTDLIVTIDAATHVVTIATPGADWSGSEDITFMATDPDGGTGQEEATFTVENSNDAPVLTVLGGQATDEDVTLAGLTVEFTDPDPMDTHTISVVPSDGNVTLENLSGHTSGSTYDLVPAANWFGTVDITVSVTDDGTGMLSDSYSFALVVSSVNDAPVLTPLIDQATDEDVDLVGATVDFSDADVSDLHTIDVASDDANVSVANLSGNVTGSTYDLVPAENWNGTAQITVSVMDDGEGTLTDSYTYLLTVNAVNDAPDTSYLSNADVLERVALGTVVGLFTTDDVDAGDIHSYSFASDGGVFDVDNASFSIVGDTLKTNTEIDYESQNSFSILVQTTDSGGETKIQNFTVTVVDVDETSVGDQYLDLGFKLYPIPASDYVNIEIDNPDNKELQLEIYSNTGSLVYAEPLFNTKRIDLSGFSDGIYVVRITGEKIFSTGKLVVKDR